MYIVLLTLSRQPLHFARFMIFTVLVFSRSRFRRRERERERWTLLGERGRAGRRTRERIETAEKAKNENLNSRRSPQRDNFPCLDDRSGE